MHLPRLWLAVAASTLLAGVGHGARLPGPARGSRTNVGTVRTAAQRMLGSARKSILRAETKVLASIEPKNTSGFRMGPPPSIFVGGYNILEVGLVKAGLMRALKPYTKWAEGGTLMRGSQPTDDGFRALKEQGIKTVINLRRESNDEKGIVEQLGMTAIWLPSYDQGTPSRAQVNAFLKVMLNPKNQPVFIHCEQGHGRTGVFGAIFRIAHDGYTADRAIAEAKQLGMNSKIQERYIQTFAETFTSGKYQID